MKILLMSLLLVSCGIDSEKDTEKVGDTDKTSSSNDLATKYQGKKFSSVIRCTSNTITDGEGEEHEEPFCLYLRATENSECGTSDDQCQIIIRPEGPVASDDKKQGIIEDICSDEKKGIWPLTSWTAECTCSERKITPSQEEDLSMYQCEDGKCSLEELQKGVVSKAIRNYQPISDDNKLSELEKDMLNDLVKEAFDDLPQKMFRDYFAKQNKCSSGN